MAILHVRLEILELLRAADTAPRHNAAFHTRDDPLSRCNLPILHLGSTSQAVDILPSVGQATLRLRELLLQTLGFCLTRVMLNVTVRTVEPRVRSAQLSLVVRFDAKLAPAAGLAARHSVEGRGDECRHARFSVESCTARTRVIIIR